MPDFPSVHVLSSFSKHEMVLYYKFIQGNLELLDFIMQLKGFNDEKRAKVVQEHETRYDPRHISSAGYSKRDVYFPWLWSLKNLPANIRCV